VWLLQELTCRRNVSIVRAERLSELGTTLVVTDRSRGPGFDSQFDNQIFLEVVDLERDAPILVRIIEELRSRKPRLTAVCTHCTDHATSFYPLKLALTRPTSGGRSVGIIRLRTEEPRSLFVALQQRRHCCSVQHNSPSEARKAL
jgi:hypothetical protein